MRKWLAVAAIVAMATGCAALDDKGRDNRAFAGPGAQTAAMLGFHGPVHRQPVAYAD